jgi:predicted nucleotidyltransferase
MVTADTIASDIVRRILGTARPNKIVLFGSRARESHRAGSDYDLLVIQPSDQPRYRRAVPFYRAMAGLPAEVDVVVYTPEEVADWSAVPEAFVTTALREGVVLYEGQG